MSSDEACSVFNAKIDTSNGGNGGATKKSTGLIGQLDYFFTRLEVSFSCWGAWAYGVESKLKKKNMKTWYICFSSSIKTYISSFHIFLFDFFCFLYYICHPYSFVDIIQGWYALSLVPTSVYLQIQKLRADSIY